MNIVKNLSIATSGATFIILLASNSAHAAITNFDLNANGVPESSAVSTGTYSPIFPACLPCTITHTVSNGTAAAQNFNWTGPGFVGIAPGFTPATVTFTTYLSVVEATGNISFVPAAVAGPANYQKPVKSAVVEAGGELIELISSLSKSPINIEFKSTLTPLGSDSFEYTHTVTNFLSTPVDFSWSAANFSGTVPANDSISMSFISSLPANERVGSTFFTLNGDEFIMPAHAWVAVPEPLTLLGAGTALGFGAFFKRETSKKQKKEKTKA